MSSRNIADSTADSPVITRALGITVSGRQRIPETLHRPDRPLVIAIHGGTYSSAYFDVAGYSLLDRAQTLGIPIIAVDRPGYGASAAFASSKPTIERNAEILDVAIGEIWQGFRDAVSGIVLIGHSIGGAVSIAISARKPAWPLLGLAISGVGLTPVPESEEQWAALPDVPAIELPSALKDQYMFGPTGTFDERIMPAASHISDAPAPRAELLDIVTGWPAAVNSLAREITVPVHYRQAEFDRLWVTDAEQVRLFAAAFAQANSVSAELYPQAGHCIDFHRVGEAFQFEQLAFALRCAVRSGV